MVPITVTHIGYSFVYRSSYKSKCLRGHVRHQLQLHAFNPLSGGKLSQEMISETHQTSTNLENLEGGWLEKLVASRGVWRHAPPKEFDFFRPILGGCSSQSIQIKKQTTLSCFLVSLTTVPRTTTRKLCSPILVTMINLNGGEGGGGG